MAFNGAYVIASGDSSWSASGKYCTSVAKLAVDKNSVAEIFMLKIK